MIVFTSLLLNLAAISAPLEGGTLAWTPLPPSVPEQATEDQRYDKSEHTLRDDPGPETIDKNEGTLQNDSYFGQENAPYTQGYVAAPMAPPSPINEPIPPPPYSYYVWTPGYWQWRTSEWRWVYGEWVNPPYEGAQWEPGYWYKREENWYWQKGRWK